MIFVTIGSMFPFDRLIRAMDAWAAERAPETELLAQIGAGAYEPRNMPWVRRLDQADFARTVARYCPGVTASSRRNSWAK